jgi:hypothetical protein
VYLQRSNTETNGTIGVVHLSAQKVYISPVDANTGCEVNEQILLASESVRKLKYLAPSPYFLPFPCLNEGIEVHVKRGNHGKKNKFYFIAKVFGVTCYLSVIVSPNEVSTISFGGFL